MEPKRSLPCSRLPFTRPYSDPAKVYYIFVILSGVRLSALGNVATTGLLYQPQTTDDGDCGATGGMEIGETDVLGKNLPQHHFVHHKPHMTRPGLPWWEAGD
jgi:hypothetical protein